MSSPLHRNARSGSLARLAVLAAFLAGPSALFAAKATVTTVNLPTVVVTATGVPEDSFTLPYATSQIDAGKLERQLPRALPVALQEEPGIMVQKTALAQGSPYIRGFTGFRTLMMIDGVRLNHAAFREGPNQYWSTVDPFSFNRLDVVKGPASVIYGSDAIGGTVNALTSDPAVKLSDDSVKTSNGIALYRYSSAEDSHTFRLAEDKRRSDRLTMHTGITFRENGNLRGGGDTGEMPETGFREHALDLRTNYIVRDNVTIKAAFQHLAQDDAWRSHTTVLGSRWHGVIPASDFQRSLDQDRQLAYLQYHAVNQGGAADQVHAGISWQHQGEQQYRLRSNSRTELTGFDVDSFGAFLRAHSSAKAAWHWVCGGEFYRDRLDSYSRKYLSDGSLSKTDIQGPVADAADYDLAGGYLECHMPKLGPVSLIAGGRYNYAAAASDLVADPLTGNATTIDTDWESVIGSLRGTMNIDKSGKWILFAGVSQALRAPNLSDLTRFDIAEGNQIETPSPDLNPERFITSEAGLRTRSEKWSADASWFFTAIDNQIIRTPTGRIIEGRDEVTKRNSGSGYITGVELSLRWLPTRDVSFWIQGTWMEGEIDVFPTADATIKVREPVSRIMPLTGVAGVRWAPKTSLAWIEIVGCAAAKQDKLSGNDIRDTERIPPGGTPGYGVFHLRAGYRYSEKLSFTAAVENITDRDYRIHGSGLNEPGRNLVLAVTARF